MEANSSVIEIPVAKVETFNGGFIDIDILFNNYY